MKSSVELSDVADLVDSLHKTPKYSDSGKPMVRVTDVKYGNLDLSKTFKVSDQVFEEFSRRYKPKKGDIVITRVGTYGISAKVDDTNFCMGQNISVIIPKNICSDYLYSFLNSSNAKEQIESSVVGSTQKTLSLKSINALKIPRFGDEVEFKIGKIYSTFDNQIHTSKLINSTLEEILQTIFNSWFVDFLPVHVKAMAVSEGFTPEQVNHAAVAVISGVCTPEKFIDDFDEMNKKLENKLSIMSKEEKKQLFEIASMFPDNFEEVEEIEVPMGWCKKNVDEVTSHIFSGGTPSTKEKSYWNGCVPWLSSGETRERFITGTEKYITKLGVESSSTKFAKPFDIVIASAGQGFTRGQTSLLLLETCINQSVVTLRADENFCNKTWLFFNLASRYVEMRNISDSSSSRGSLTTKLLKEMPIILPSKDLISKFDEIALSSISIIENNLHKIKKLQDTRDTLLPKLLNGELDLSCIDID